MDLQQISPDSSGHSGQFDHTAKARPTNSKTRAVATALLGPPMYRDIAVALHAHPVALHNTRTTAAP